jgi:hypothetical protein
VSGRLKAAIRDSNLIGGWRKPENQIAYAALAVVVVIVVVTSQFPLRPGFTIDLRDPVRYEGLWQVIPVALSTPNEYGRRIGPTSRLVLNRPLPEKFSLQIEARSMGKQKATVNVRVGDFHERVHFGRANKTVELSVVNPQSVRDIEIRQFGDPVLEIARISVR